MKTKNVTSSNSKIFSQATTKAMSRDELITFLDSILASSTEYSIIALNLEGEILAWNEGAHRIYGYDSKEVIGKHSYFLHDPDDVKSGKAQTILHETYAHEKWMGEVKRIRKDGTLFTARLTSTLRKNHEGMPVGFTLISRDMTGEKKLYSQIAETSLFLNNILESSTQYSIIALDLTGKILMWNAGAQLNYGFTKAEMINKQNYRVLHIQEDITSGRVDKFLETVMKTGKGEGIFERVRKDNSHFIASVVMTLRTNAENKPIGYLLISKDITEHKKLEQQMLKNREIEEQAKLILQASRFKSKFLANMSHELRTPLNAIIGFTSLIHRGKVGDVNEKQKEFLNDILNSSKHLLHLINDILDLSRVESGKLLFYPEKTDLNSLLPEVINCLRPLIDEKQLQLSTHVDASVAFVCLDPKKFKQLLYNFVSNAIKFTPVEGSVDVSIIPEGEEYFRLVVKDNGAGIAPELIKKVFYEFLQNGSHKMDPNQGAGIGLTLSRKLVEAQGGQIGVQSELNKGSTFFAVLPRLPLSTV